MDKAFQFIREYNIDINDPIESLIDECLNRQLDYRLISLIIDQFYTLIHPSIDHVPTELILNFFESLSFKPNIIDVEKIIEDYLKQLSWDWNWISVMVIRYIIASLVG